MTNTARTITAAAMLAFFAALAASGFAVAFATMTSFAVVCAALCTR